VVTLRPVPVTSTRIAGIQGPAQGRFAGAVDRTSMSAVSAELEHPSLASSLACVTQTVARLSYAPLARPG
jgi:hypothetical protein